MSPVLKSSPLVALVLAVAAGAVSGGTPGGMPLTLLLTRATARANARFSSPVFKTFVHICAQHCGAILFSCRSFSPARLRSGTKGSVLRCFQFNVWKNRDCGWLVQGGDLAHVTSHRMPPEQLPPQTSLPVIQAASCNSLPVLHKLFQFNGEL